MLLAATKYTPVNGAAAKAAAPAPAARTSVPAGVVREAPWKNIHRLADDVARIREKEAQKRGVTLFIPSHRRMMSMREWNWKELREGGVLYNYLRRRRHQTVDRWRGCARARQDFQQNNKSDLRLAASVPAYDFFRWRKVDPYFWDDEKNIKNLRRDNPNHVGSVFL